MKLTLTLILMGALATHAFSQMPLSQGYDKHEISFKLVPNPAFEACLADDSGERPSAWVFAERGELNDQLILVTDHVKRGLNFDLFTVQRSPFLDEGVPDPSFKSFGLAWYQSDVEAGKRISFTRIKTILLDQIFGFDPDKSLAPTNTFHVGFWFNDPKDAAPCGFDVTKPTPFNGEHRAGPLAMISVPDSTTKLGPLCTKPETLNGVFACHP